MHIINTASSDQKEDLEAFPAQWASCQTVMAKAGKDRIRSGANPYQCGPSGDTGWQDFSRWRLHQWTAGLPQVLVAPLLHLSADPEPRVKYLPRARHGGRCWPYCTVSLILGHPAGAAWPVFHTGSS